MARRATIVAMLLVLAGGCDHFPEPAAPGDPSFSRGVGQGPVNAASRATPSRATPVPAPAETAEEIPGDLDALASFLWPDTRGATIVNESIGPEGGSVRLGDFEIVVPAGAVDSNTNFQIRLPPESHRDRVWAEFRPHNRSFNVPVLLRLPHAGTDAEAGAPALWWNGSAWEALITTPLNDGRVETSVDHFSVYGVSRVRGFTLPGG